MADSNLNTIANVKQIPLSKGFFALVDEEDYQWLSQWEWHASAKGKKCQLYANAYGGGGRKRQKTHYMHRIILKATPDKVVDHINGNTLDNRKTNLRIVSQSENMRNRKSLNTNNTSGVPGISWDKSRNKWKADIRINYKTIFLGRFCEFTDAVESRKRASLKYHGEFSNMNLMNP